MNKIKNQIMNIIKEELDEITICAFLFDSYEINTSTQTSDINIGLISDKKLLPETIFKLRDRFENEVETLRKIDIVDYFDIEEQVFLNKTLEGEVFIESMEILQKQLKEYDNFIINLEKYCKEEKDVLVIGSVISVFEFSFKLLWKIVKKLAKHENIDCDSPRYCIKTAYQLGLINDEDTFLTILEYNKPRIYLYGDFEADELYNFVIEKGLQAFKDIEEKIKNRINAMVLEPE